MGKEGGWMGFLCGGGGCYAGYHLLPPEDSYEGQGRFGGLGFEEALAAGVAMMA